MAIVFDCPHCQTPYRLRDELAGKPAKCKNPVCGRVMTIPQPNTGPAAAPPTNGKVPSSAEVEAAALAALADEVQEEAPAATTIALSCPSCDHQWAEPVEKAGKNVLCPECRTRVKVPVPKGTAQRDWRTGPQGPSLAKENFEKPADVMDVSSGAVVGKEAWQKGGGADADLEPIPLKRKLMWATIVLTPLLLIAGGAWYAWTTWTRAGQDRFMEEAVAGFAAAQGELPAAEAPVCEAVLQWGVGEYELRQDRDRAEALKLALNAFTKARAKLGEAAAKDDGRRTGAVRLAAAAELAVAQVGLGGTDDEVNAGARIRWVPEPIGNRALRANEKPRHVHDELTRTLQLVLGADADLRFALARRLTQKLAQAGQAGLATDQLPSMLFGDADRAEGQAWIALEVYRLDKGSDRPGKVAADLRGAGDKGPGGPAAQALARVAGPEKGPPPPPEAQANDAVRLSAVAQHLLEGRPADALELARKPGWAAAGRLRALTLCAEWGPDAGAAAEAAAALVPPDAKGKRETGLPPFAVLRLIQLGAQGGKPDAARTLAETIADDGLRAWALGEVIRGTSLGGGTAPVEESAADAPDDPKQARAGHAWGRLWLARHNTRVGDPAAVKRSADLWPTWAKPFGLAGIALGLKDR